MRCAEQKVPRNSHERFPNRSLKRWRRIRACPWARNQGYGLGMSKTNPLTRVTLSRQTLYKYRAMPGGSGDKAEWLLKQVR